MARESDWKLFTNAGPEIGVASTKAFTTQLSALLMLAVAIAKSQNKNEEKRQEAKDKIQEEKDKLQEAYDKEQDRRRELRDEAWDKGEDFDPFEV